MRDGSLESSLNLLSCLSGSGLMSGDIGFIHFHFLKRVVSYSRITSVQYTKLGPIRVVGFRQEALSARRHVRARGYLRSLKRTGTGLSFVPYR